MRALLLVLLMGVIAAGCVKPQDAAPDGGGDAVDAVAAPRWDSPAGWVYEHRSAGAEASDAEVTSLLRGLGRIHGHHVYSLSVTENLTGSEEPAVRVEYRTRADLNPIDRDGNVEVLYDFPLHVGKTYEATPGTAEVVEERLLAVGEQARSMKVLVIEFRDADGRLVREIAYAPGHMNAAYDRAYDPATGEPTHEWALVRGALA